MEPALILVEHRTEPRRRVLKAAVIGFGGAGITCTVRNISNAGALLEVESPLGVPDRFTLHIEAEQSKRACRVIRRQEKRIDVAFE